MIGSYPADVRHGGGPHLGETTVSEQVKCGLCGEPMPPGEEMFKYHGYSGPCPKPSQPAQDVDDHPPLYPDERGDWAASKPPK